MTHILPFFWIKGHDKKRPKETCFKCPTWLERRREIRPTVGIMLGRSRAYFSEEGGAL